MTINPHFSAADYFYMRRALVLASYGRFTTHPNPNVGCVIVHPERVQDERWPDAIVGEGYHARAGEPHAEVYALKAAADQASGATVYVTLEPCSHHGRTPPCADALIAAGVSRVVVAMTDPFPEVSGRGIARLREAGITVDVGLCGDEAYTLNRGFFTRIARNRPFVVVKLAASMDGKIALANGESQWITSPAARADVQLGRAQAGAILTGARTVLKDNPQLNVRVDQFPDDHSYGDMPVRQPLRIVLDARAEVPRDARILNDGEPVCLVRLQPSGQKLPAHVEEWVVQSDSQGRIDLPLLLAQIGERNIHTLWVESGARLAGSLMQAHLVDELILYQAPKFLGPDGLSLVELPEFTRMDDVLSWDLVEATRVGPDVKLILRQPDAAQANEES
ncbi:bifunctional diaminohydroxyphosphoribosylaminopyrimidine deaminase/5-amino-6-(5-phosphoribosylamino)uracil reductase RibD [Aliidiomarina indica]|uniref:bifunctional diaminohydroxyphosphoribosylaminopyrimidine deaminase/5-amino-6-(5-phosphoribosylamino)uracil reductase RibD n=1 Tax=Aliidiomarina indica TaxID=2749147 RepID=UPI001E47BE9A|nr:bifunctional diaminohydroxyphosphoribosylaminopyrimidine deaminase/5-amino-6-(5-phosphoribosylamino)uracil reductase RibD [Aliidiomarina indica]